MAVEKLGMITGLAAIESQLNIVLDIYDSLLDVDVLV